MSQVRCIFASAGWRIAAAARATGSLSTLSSVLRYCSSVLRESAMNSSEWLLLRKL